MNNRHEDRSPMTTEEIVPCQIFIDKEGRWFHKGAEMIHREFIRLFYENMEVDEEGRTIIHWNGERCQVEVEDTAYVVRRVEVDEGRIVLLLSDDARDVLSPGTVVEGADHVLYCRVRDGRFPARFTRPAYYQLAEHIVEQDGRYLLSLEGRTWNLEGLGPCVDDPQAGAQPV